jgi:two-component system, chemotaxis family, chemotaxis protein CheY
MSRPASQMSADVKRTVFIADDDEVARALLKSLLVASGMNVVGEAADGKQALADIKRLSPDIVCLDIDMPMMSGLDVLARVRGTNDRMIALIVTASPTAQNVREAIQVKADGVIAKPFSQEKIHSEITRAAARKMLKR